MSQCKTARCYKRKDLVDGYCSTCVTKRNKEKTVHEYICPECDIVAKDDEECMCCDFCSEWFHIGCIGMSSEVYKIVFADDVPGVQWYCKKCQSKTKEALEKYSALEKQTKALRVDVDNIKTDVTEVKDIIKNTIRHEINQNMDEMKERESRKLNLVVFGLPEVPSDETEWTNEKKIEADIKEIESIIMDDIGVALSPRTGVIDARRLGMKKANAPRPLKIIFRDLNTKREVLTNAKKLRSSTRKTAQNIFINPDLTPEQRKEDEKLRSEMWTRREKGENVIIRRGKIIEADHPVRKHRIVKQSDKSTNSNKAQPKVNQSNEGAASSSAPPAAAM